ncbi:MAG: hypothetical protein F6J96_21325 [Symploca sp. SIO1C2]|nr:hypothetical protein [Symploca sp. SIO1C2]
MRKQCLPKEGKLQKAIASYQQAQKLDPNVDLDPETETLEQDLEAVMRTWTPVLIQKGENLAREGEIEKAIAKYQEAQELDPTVKITADSWNNVCWFGSLHRQAAKVLEACKNAVALASETEKGMFRDSRGVARVMTGNTQDAIEDFQAFIESTDSDNNKKQRQGWIKDLQAGKNPFTEEEIERLLEE